MYIFSNCYFFYDFYPNINRHKKYNWAWTEKKMTALDHPEDARKWRHDAAVCCGIAEEWGGVNGAT